MDHHRPCYHLCPPKNWMNDPNGAIQWNGKYHLFYQYNPNGAFSSTKHWGHAVSPDLIHWDHLPIALAPEPGSYDNDGCFSGTMVVNQGVPTIIYTGVKPEVQCLAMSDDNLWSWKKFSGNPVLTKPLHLSLMSFRDPYVWQDEKGIWNMVVGSGIKGLGGSVLLYSSQDLINWNFETNLLTGKTEENGFMWNCPNFFPIGDKQVLIVSGQPVWKLFYWTGEFQNSQFTPITSGLADYGGCLYASLVFQDSNKRTLFWGWIWESRTDQQIREAGWAGVMALPRIPFLNADGTLGFQPAPETLILRQKYVRLSNYDCPNGINLFDKVRGLALEVRIQFQLGDADGFGIHVFSAIDQSEYTRIGFDAIKKEIFIDRSNAKLSPTMFENWPNPDYHAVPANIHPGEIAEFHIFIDHSVIEVFTHQGITLSSRVYPTYAQCDCLFFYSIGERTLIPSLEVWELA